MNDMRLELKKLVSYFVLSLLIVKSCYKIDKIERCKDVKKEDKLCFRNSTRPKISEVLMILISNDTTKKDIEE